MAEARVIGVNVPGAAYEVLVRPGLLEDVGRLLRRLSSAKRAVVITDSQVGPLYAKKAATSLREEGFDPIVATFPAGEDNKTIETVCAIYDQILPKAIDRAVPVVALGGGVAGDMAGFVAATILRGVPFVQVPTSLLAMVDASVGGKTGVNHRVGKNLIGAFHQPLAVFIDPQTLRTLPPRELRGGLAECIKHDIIRDAEGFAQLETNIARALALDMEYLSELVAHNVAIKARVVEADPLEKGERAHLNFGHTFAHAIETLSHYAYSHGEAVALGMIAAARTAVHMGMLDSASAERIAALVRAAGLPAGGMSIPTDEVIGALIYDKKVRGGRVRFVLPERLGRVVIRDDVPEDAVRAGVESIR